MSQDDAEPALSQLSPGSVLSRMKAIEKQSVVEYEAMKARIKSSTDPGDGAVDRLRGIAVQAWRNATGSTVPWQNLCDCLNAADAQLRDLFFESWCDGVWDAKAVNEATNFHAKGSNISVKDYMKEHTEEFYTELLREKSPDPRRAQELTPVRSMAPAEIADACSRVSVGTDCPRTDT